MNAYLWLPWLLPDFNTLINKRGERYTRKAGSSRRSRGDFVYRDTLAQANAREPGDQNGYAVMKKKWEEAIGLLARTRGFVVHPGCWAFSYLFVEPTIRRDPSNVCSGAIKLIEDALQRAKLMDRDGWGTVREIHSYFVKLPKDFACEGILVCIGDTVPTAREMLEQARVMSNAERFHRKEGRRAARHQVGPQPAPAPAEEPKARGR